jgi:hypothetical protein
MLGEKEFKANKVPDEFVGYENVKQEMEEDDD